MRSLVRLLLLFVIALVWSSGGPVQAAAPFGWVRSDGQLFRWDVSQRISYSIDQGTLGRLSIPDSTALVQSAFQRWDDVETAAVNFTPGPPLPQDITGANVVEFLENLPPGLNPVIFDADGSVIRALGFDPLTTVALGRPRTNDPASGIIHAGVLVLNGLFIDGRFNPDDLSVDDYRGMAVQEIGRFLGLGYTDLNAELILDGSVENNRLIPQMYPVPVPGNGDQLTVDDRASVTALYPNPVVLPNTGTIRGQVLLPDGVTGLQGINVIARRVGDPAVTAVSAISGIRFKNDLAPAPLNGSRQVALRGAYELTGLPPGQYIVSIQALRPESQAGPRRPPASLPGGTRFYQSGGASTADPNAATQVTVNVGQAVENVNLIVNGPVSLPPQPLNEQEPNQFPESAQTLPAASRVQGAIQPGDASGVNIPLSGGGSAAVQDLYRLALGQPTLLTVTLSATDPGSDLNLYLLSGPVATSPRVTGISTDPGTPPESLQLRVPAGIYFLAVGHASGPGTAYTLEVSATASPTQATAAAPKPRLNNLVVVNVTPTGAATGFISDLPSNTIIYVSNPLTEFSNPQLVTTHQQTLSGLAAGTAFRLRALAVTQALGIGTLPDVVFTTALTALPGGVGQISAGVSDIIEDPDDPNAVFVVLSFRNVGTGDASGVTIMSLSPPPGWSFSNPLPTPLGLGFLGRGGSGIIMTRLVRSGAGPDDAPIITGSGTYFSPAVGQQTFTFGGAVASLILNKAADVSTARPGDLVTFTLSVANQGQGPASGVVLSDTLPAGTTFVDATSGGQFQNNAVIWNLGTLAPGAAGSVSFRVRVPVNVTSGATITNVAQMRSTEIPTPIASNVVAVGVVPPPPQLQLGKSADRSTARPGEVIAYTLTFANVGSTPASNIVLTDTVPNGTVFVDATGAVSTAGGVVTWNLGTLNAGQIGSRTLRVQVAPNTPGGTTVANTAQLTANELPAPVTSNQAITQVTAPPQLQLGKSADRNSARPGDLITYSLTISNPGSGPATNVQLFDAVPAGTSFVDASSGGSLQGGSVVWNLGTVAPGASGAVSFRVQVQASAAGAGSINNVAQIRSAETQEPVTSNNVAVSITAQPQLQVAKSADRQTAQPGQVISYTITVRNVGQGPATGVQLFDTVPTGTNFMDAGSGGGLVGGNTVGWNLGTLAPGGAVSVLMRVQVVANSGTITNVAQARSSETPNLVTSNQVATGILSQPQLQLSKQADRQTARPGDIINFSLTASNVGQGPATNVQVFDAVPNGTTFLSASPGGGLVSGNTVGWNLGSLAPGSSSNVSFRVQVVANSGTITNVGQVRSAEAPNLATSNQVAVNIVAPPQLSLTKQADRQTAGPGDIIVFTLSFNNAGPGTANGVRITDDLPSGTTFVDAPGGSFTGSSVTWFLSPLPPGATGSRTLRVRVAGNTPGGTPITNTAQITSQETGPINSNPATVTVTAPPQLQITKGVDRASASPGDTITYTLNFANSGSGPATGVTIQDQLPPNTTFVGASAPGVLLGNVVFWNIGTLQSGQSGAVQLQVRVAPNTPGGTPINNTARISSNEVPTAVPSNTVTVTVVVVAPPSRLAVTKAVDVANVSPGGLINFTLTVQNTGGSPATGVILVDPVPQGTTPVAASNGGALQGGAVRWNIGTLAPGAAAQVSLRVQVNNNPPGTITNTAQATSTQEPNPVASNTVSVTVNVPLNLAINKVVDQATVAPGEQIRYVIAFRNNGSAPVGGVVIRDTIPANTQFLQASQGVTPVNGVLTWNIGTVNPGQEGSVAFVVRSNQNLPNGTQINNQATILVPAQQYAQNSNTVTTTVNVAAPSLTLSKAVDRDTAGPNDTLTYTLTYANTGSQPFNAATIVDPLPQGVTFLDAQNNGQLSAGAVRFDIGLLAPGATGSVSFRVRIVPDLDAGTVIINRGLIGGPSLPQPIESNAVSTTVSAAPPPSLTITKAVDRTSALPGETLTYTLNFANNGQQPVAQVAIVDPLPQGVTFLDAQNNGQLNAGAVRWNIGTIPPAASGSVSFRVTINSDVASGTVIANRGLIGAPALPQPIESNQVTTTVGTAPPPSLTITKAVDKTSAAPGETVTYTLTFANNGQQPVAQVAIVDPLPQGVTFLDAQNNGQLNAGAVRWNIGTIPPGASGSVSFRVTINADVPNGTVIANRGLIGAPALPQPIESNQVTTTVGTAPPPSFAGTWAAVPPTGHAVSLSVDPQNKFTVWAVSADRQTVQRSAQGVLNADGSFDVTSSDGLVRFTGQVAENRQSAAITAARTGFVSFTVTAPRLPDVNQLPAPLVGTFTGFADAANGDRIRVRITADPVGNATFHAEVIRTGAGGVRNQFATFYVTPDGRLINPAGNAEVGVLQVSGNNLVLIYNFQQTGYQNTFQVTLERQ